MRKVTLMSIVMLVTSVTGAVAAILQNGRIFQCQEFQMMAPPGWRVEEVAQGNLLCRIIEPTNTATIEVYAVSGWGEDLPAIERAFVEKFQGGKGLLAHRVSRRIRSVNGKQGVAFEFEGNLAGVRTGTAIFVAGHKGRAAVLLGAFPRDRGEDLGKLVMRSLNTLRFRPDRETMDMPLGPPGINTEARPRNIQPAKIVDEPVRRSGTPVAAVPVPIPDVSTPGVDVDMTDVTEPPAAARPTGSGRTCPNCRLEFPATARFCLKCGGSLTDSQHFSRAMIATCLNCRREVMPGTTLCPHCRRSVGSGLTMGAMTLPGRPVNRTNWRTVSLADLEKDCDVETPSTTDEVICQLGEVGGARTSETGAVSPANLTFRPYTGVVVDDGYLEKSTYDVVDGFKNGEMKVWAKDTGTLIRSVQYLRGLKHGLEKTYDRWDGFLETATYYEGGIRHGPFRSFWEGGQMASEVPFIGGKAHGISRQFNMDGALAETIEYYNGEVKKRGTPVIYCTDCGEKIPAPAKFCRVCGKQLTTPTSRFYPIEAIQPRLFEVRAWRGMEASTTGSLRIPIAPGEAAIADGLDLEATVIDITVSRPDEKREAPIPLLVTLGYVDGGSDNIEMEMSPNLETDVLAFGTDWSPGRRLKSIQVAHKTPGARLIVRRAQIQVAR